MIRETAILLFAGWAAQQAATVGELDGKNVSGRLALILMTTSAALVVPDSPRQRSPCW